LERKWRVLKHRKILIAVAVPVMAGAVMISGFAWANSNELADMIKNNETVTLTVAEPSTYKVSAKTSQSKLADWEQLDQMKNYTTFRSDFDKLFHINIITMNGVNGKSGCMYIDKAGDRNGNTCLADAFRNKAFVEKYWKKNETQESIRKIVSEAYSDVGSNSDYARTSAINAYYNLFSDNVDQKTFNSNQSLTREQFLTAVYKAEHPVNTEYAKKYSGNNDVFVKAIGGSDAYTPFVKQENRFSWLNTQDGSMTISNLKAPISRAEAVYTLIVDNFNDKYNSLDLSTVKNDPFSDVHNGGNMAGKEKGQTKWKLYTLAYDIKKDDKMQEGLYKAFVLAEKYGIVIPDANNNARWNETLSRSECIDLLTKTQLAKDEVYGYQSDEEYGKNNANKFTVINGKAQEIDGQLILNPKIDPDTKDVYGEDAQGEIVVVDSKDWIKKDQELAAKNAEQNKIETPVKQSSTKSSVSSSSSSKKSSSKEEQDREIGEAIDKELGQPGAGVDNCTPDHQGHPGSTTPGDYPYLGS
jgi:hypothetical protein